ncbi:MAG TPA: MCE family protein [Mycobacterium sp.]|jgi:virulence factor Mce-like protein|nr:MCE family protein [Mycobacterium sp.]
MTRNRLLKLALAPVLAVALVGGVAVVVQQTFFRPNTITAYFTKTVAIYPGDEVRIAGVKVGTIDSIEPVGTQAKMTLRVNRRISVPIDAKAVIVAQNLISARYVQLAPAYESGPKMTDGAVIPLDRTAIPVEWDEVKEQLMRLATELGPDKGMSTGSVGRFIDSAANALDGNGDKLRQTLAQLSGVGRILADGSGNIVDTISNLQTFVTALRDSNNQIVQFQDRFATLTSVVDDSRSDLDAALKNLSEVVGETQRFIEGTRDKTAEQIRLLASVTQNLADHRMDLENVLHIAPHSIANAVNMFDPRTGAASGVFVLNNLSNPVWAVCTMMGALENVTSPETGKLCSQYVGPALRTLNFNNLPIPINPFLTSNPPDYMLRYSEDRLRPENEGQPPPPYTDPPAVSAYTGAGDISPPPGYGPPPGPPPAASLPMAPPPAPPAPTLQDMLLPAEAPPPPGDAPTGPPPGDGTPR